MTDEARWIERYEEVGHIDLSRGRIVPRRGGPRKMIRVMRDGYPRVVFEALDTPANEAKARELLKENR